jgi:hypothetical protein
MHAEPQPPQAGWPRLRCLVESLAPRLSGPPPDGLGLCGCCRGPAGRDSSRCFQCDLHAELMPGMLPDVVVPVAYAVKGGEHARNLWLYKSGQPGAAAARVMLGALLMVFLADHGQCVWRRAGMTRPSHVAVIPSSRGRPGPHPLRALVAGRVALPWAPLELRSAIGKDLRNPSPDRFRTGRLPGAAVVLLDDTWTSGASAASAAAVLKLAGARQVAVIVLGRHVAAPTDHPAGSSFSPEAMPFNPERCAVHETPAVAAGPRP